MIGTSYNTTTGGGYYLLPQQHSPNAAASNGNSQTASSASAASNNLSAYLLDLSPEAKSYLSGTTNIVNTGSDAFVLSVAQQKKLNDILDKYKDQPYNQDTFNQIQADLQQAGLSPDQLAGQAKAKSYNSTLVLLDALSSKDSGNSQFNQNESLDYDTKKTNYIKQIGSQFQALAAQALA